MRACRRRSGTPTRLWPPDVPRYTQALEYETLIHLANVFQAKEKWTTVLNYLNRATRIKPDDPGWSIRCNQAIQ